MNKLEELIEKANGRDKLSTPNKDTAIEEELAALYVASS